VEEELGGELGYGPWSLAWWWMQNEEDPLRRITVTNSWAEKNLMQALRLWRTEAEQSGYCRIAELCDYLQADELTHVKLATNWLRHFTDNDPPKRDDLVHWGTEAVARIEGFYADANGRQTESGVHFSFLKAGSGELVDSASSSIGES